MFLLSTLTLLLLEAVAAPPSLPDNLESASRFYDTRPRVERPQAGWQETPEGLADLRASSCAECHPAIYEEWRVSTHGQAWTDRQFQGEMSKSGNRWLCSNCHTPLMNQMEAWAVDLVDGDVERPTYVDNPAFDAVLREEGITCSACHVRDGVIEGPTGLETPSHPVRKADRFNTEEICLACHQAVQSYPGKDFICVFETGEEWRASPHRRAGLICQSCHMQPVTRPQALGAEARTGRRHFWPGAGIYKEEGHGPPLDQLPPGLEIGAQASARELVVTLTNVSAGHLLPTGDPERFILVDVEFSDRGGRPQGEARSERIGQTWKWWPTPEKLADNRLKPLEAKELRIPRPPGAHLWSVVASSHRIGEEAVTFHHLEGYPASRVTHRLEGKFP